MDFVARLCALVPPPRFHLVRSAGTLAARAACRREVVPGRPAPPPPAQPSLFDDAGTPVAGYRRMPQSASFRPRVTHVVGRAPTPAPFTQRTVRRQARHGARRIRTAGVVCAAVVAALVGGCGDDAAPGSTVPPDGGPPDAGARPACGPAALGPFEPVGRLSYGRESHVAAALGGAPVVLGGWDGARARPTVEVADPADLEAWADDAPALPSARQHHGLVVTDGAVCVVGGDDGRAVSADVRCIGRDARGSLGGAWSARPPLPGPRTGHETVRVGGYVYVLGGLAAIGGPSMPQVFVAALDADGRPGAWREATALPTGLRFGAAAATEAHLYYAGGATDRAGSASVLVAAVEADGRLGPWQEAARIAVARIGATAHAAAGHLWLVGGFGGEDTGDAVTSWPLLDDGALGPAVPGPTLPAPRWGHAAFFHDGRLLVLGGWESFDTPPRDTVLGAACP